MTEKTIVSPSDTSSSAQDIIVRRRVQGRDRAYKVAHNLFVSFKYAGAGLTYAFTTQRNFRIHSVVGTLALSLGLFLKLTPVELSVIALTAALVMAMELLNTSLEAVVDLTVGRTYHELAKIAKDCAAGAVLMLAIASVVIAGVLLLPPLIQAIPLSIPGY
jgi:diacylglycerol kinase (ATP)